MAQKQMMSVSLQHGTWEVTIDGEKVGTFASSWSGEVEGVVELRRVDVAIEEPNQSRKKSSK